MIVLQLSRPHFIVDCCLATISVVCSQSSNAGWNLRDRCFPVQSDPPVFRIIDFWLTRTPIFSGMSDVGYRVWSLILSPYPYPILSSQTHHAGCNVVACEFVRFRFQNFASVEVSVPRVQIMALEMIPPAGTKSTHWFALGRSLFDEAIFSRRYPLTTFGWSAALHSKKHDSS